ncbi:MAG: TetR/AcrR family transcriptional regulator [Acidimicrobiia bacterium]|nr:TetR/AcrR family transcriptional regulator [Acidimicrobiia bacterium]
MKNAGAKSALEQQGEETRRGILSAAVECASRHGLEGLTIGHLAKETGMSKSGLFAHFGSKEDLQMATLDAALRIFLKEVVEPAMDREGGLARLIALIDGWLSHIERRVFACGCFFGQSSLEFDSRPGRVRDRIVNLMINWRDLLESEARRAKVKRQLAPKTDPRQLVFELAGMMGQANLEWQLFCDEETFARAQAGIRARLRESATPSGRKALKA